MFADSSLSVSLEAGSLIQFLYPRHNFVGVVNEHLEPRRVCVRHAVDFRDELPDDSCRREPNLRRGRLLVVGYDLDKHAERRFYVESMSELKPLDTEAERPSLKTTILKEGLPMAPAERPDPRSEFARAFNSQAARFGMTAVA